METRELQNKIKKFNIERDWGKTGEIKDLMLNMNEEIGEMWHLIKWINEDKQKEMIEKNNKEVGNFIGDMSYLLFKIAFICNIDLEEETCKVLEEYEKRMPIDKIKQFKHGNKLAGGYDNK
ncbi:hypothetical protein FJZ19_02345 [Candidatus Pacearchaeota archaeon]|nr:hypothetical protein [Candidatus Pacearchaeota archaeon]